MASGNSLMIRVLMASKEVSGIIGKGGEIVKQFRKDSGAWINISQGTKGVASDRIVSITGSIDSIVTAFNLICDRVEEIQKDSGHQGRSRGGQSDSITLQLIIPSSQCGSIIGKGGAKVKEINEESEATVQVKNLLPDSTDKIVLVTGTSETVPVCIGLMCKVLIETPPKGVNIPYNPEGANGGGPGPQGPGSFGPGPGPIRNNSYHDDRNNWGMQPRDQIRGLLENRMGGPGSRDRRTGYERPADLREVIRRGDRFDGPPRDRFGGGNPNAGRSGLLGDGAMSEGLGGDNPLAGLLRGLSALTGTSPQASIQALTSLVSAQLRDGGPGSLAGLEREFGGGRGMGGPGALGPPGRGGIGGLLGRGLGGGDRGGPLGGSRFGGDREGPGDEQEVSEVIKVPNEKIGSIIGRGGTKIAEVRQMTGANITVSKFQEGEDAAKQERTITIEGNSDQVALAKYIINNR